MNNISRLYPAISKHSEGRAVEGNEICAHAFFNFVETALSGSLKGDGLPEN